LITFAGWIEHWDRKYLTTVNPDQNVRGCISFDIIRWLPLLKQVI